MGSGVDPGAVIRAGKGAVRAPMTSAPAARCRTRASTSIMPLIQRGAVSLSFDPQVVHASGVVFTGAWNLSTGSGTIDNDKGILADLQFAAKPGIEGRSIVATHWFAAQSVGETTLPELKHQEFIHEKDHSSYRIHRWHWPANRQNVGKLRAQRIGTRP